MITICCQHCSLILTKIEDNEDINKFRTYCNECWAKMVVILNNHTQSGGK